MLSGTGISAGKVRTRGRIIGESMRKHFFAALAACASGSALAAPGNLADGGQFSSGHVTAGFMLPLAQGNPGLLPQSLRSDQNIRTNILDLPSLAVEIGESDNFVERFEDIEDRIDAGVSNQQEAEQLRDDAEAVFADIARDGYATIDLFMPVPALPVVFRAFDGVISLHADVAASVNASVIDAGFRIVEDNGSFDVETDSAALLRSGIFQRVGVGYGRSLMDWRLGSFIGELQAGGRISLIRGDLSQVVGAIDSDDEEDAFDRIEDNYDRNEESSTGVALDAGVAFVADQFHLGLTLRNLLPPEFDFGPLGVDCGSLSGGDRADCELEAELGAQGLLDLNRSFRQETQGMIEAMYAVGETGLRVFGSLETNSVENIAGDDYQFLSAGLSYEGPWWAPNMRAGLKQNLAGSKITSLTAGITLFRVLNIDALYALDSTKVDGSSAPRNAGVRIGFSLPL